jgi:hypothetical protein
MEMDTSFYLPLSNLTNMNKLEKRLSRLERKVKQLAIDLQQTREKDERLLARIEANQTAGVWKAIRHCEEQRRVRPAAQANLDIEFGFNCFRHEQHEDKKTKGHIILRTATSTTASSSHKGKSSSQSSSTLSLSPKAILTMNMIGPRHLVAPVPCQSLIERRDRTRNMNTDTKQLQRPTDNSNNISWDDGQRQSFEDYSRLDASTKRERIRQGMEIHQERIQLLLSRMIQQAFEESHSF